MPEMPKPLLSETLSMPLLQYESSEEVEIGSGDEERLLPTDLLNDDDEEIKPTLRKTWSWTPEAKAEEVQKFKKSERNLERAIKSLSIDPNVSISRKF